MTQSTGQPPPGWYDDPSGEHDKRYWDGAAWTEHISPRQAASAGGGHGSITPSGESYYAPAQTPQSAPPRLHILQKVTPLQNVYRVHWDDNGSPGQLLAFVKQKRMALKEAFTVYADEASTQPVLSIRADRRIDIRSTMTVYDPTGQQVGVVRKKGRESLVRSTWELEQPGLPVVTITERSMLIAILRRVWGFVPYANNIPVPWVFHFDAVAEDGEAVFSHTRIWGWRDRYVMEIHDQRLDFRMAVAIGILMDAMQHR